MPEPVYSLRKAAETHGESAREAIADWSVEEYLIKKRPDILKLIGDTAASQVVALADASGAEVAEPAAPEVDDDPEQEYIVLVLYGLILSAGSYGLDATDIDDFIYQYTSLDTDEALAAHRLEIVARIESRLPASQKLIKIGAEPDIRYEIELVDNILEPIVAYGQSYVPLEPYALSQLPEKEKIPPLIEVIAKELYDAISSAGSFGLDMATVNMLCERSWLNNEETALMQRRSRAIRMLKSKFLRGEALLRYQASGGSRFVIVPDTEDFVLGAANNDRQG